MTKTSTYMTQEGYSAIEKEYEDLQSSRPDLVNKLTEAANMGDRSENAAYTNAKRKLRSTDSRLRFLKKVLDFTKVVKPVASGFVEIGSKVVVKFNRSTTEFHVVGLHEADPMEKKVTYNSPIGKALLGKKEGDVVRITTPNGEIEYEVIEITV